MNKIQELETLADELKPEIILLTETWCNNTIPDAALSITGYNLETDLRKDRHDTGNGVGGGLLVYSKEGSKFIPLESFDNSEFNQFCGFSTGTHENIINFILAYRPPSSGNENTERLCEILKNLPPKTIMIGDINMPNINWATMESDSKGRKLVETIEEEGLTQLVEFCTHLKGNILDLIISNCPEKIISITDMGRLGKSDHSILLLEIEGKSSNTQIRTGKCWHKANWQEFTLELKNENWAQNLENMDVEAAWKYLRDKIEEGSEKHIQTFVTSRKWRPPWLSQTRYSPQNSCEKDSVEDQETGWTTRTEENI